MQATAPTPSLLQLSRLSSVSVARSHPRPRLIAGSRHPPRSSVSLRRRSISSSSSCSSPSASATALSPSTSGPHFYRSTSTDPYLNLAIENHLLTHSHPDSKVVFLYANRPCVVLGRNQNPWVECDLKALRRRGAVVRHVNPDQESHNAGGSGGGAGGRNAKAGGEGEEEREGEEVLLVRRRSGGGTVFHDSGNLNYSVIVPNDAAFKRDKHAHMVVRAIQHLQQISGQHRQDSSDRDDYNNDDYKHDEQIDMLKSRLLGDLLENKHVRVNDRNDIVMDLPHLNQTLKISGSAFRLTRGRALHHGTLLYSSPNLKRISPLLRSPAREFISAKGVDSVRSPVGNLAYVEDVLERAKIRQLLEREILSSFRTMYDISPGETTYVGEKDAEAIDKIRKGREEIMQPQWRFEQTPSFVFSNRPVEGEDTFNPATIPGIPETAKVFFRVKNGILQEVDVSLSSDDEKGSTAAQQEKTQIQSALQGKKLHEITDWNHMFRGLDVFTHPSTGALIEWLAKMFPPMSALPTVHTDLATTAATATTTEDVVSASSAAVEQPREDGELVADVKRDAALHQQPQYR